MAALGERQRVEEVIISSSTEITSMFNDAKTCKLSIGDNQCEGGCSDIDVDGEAFTKTKVLQLLSIMTRAVSYMNTLNCDWGRKYRYHKSLFIQEGLCKDRSHYYASWRP